MKTSKRVKKAALYAIRKLKSKSKAEIDEIIDRRGEPSPEAKLAGESLQRYIKENMKKDKKELRVFLMDK